MATHHFACILIILLLLPTAANAQSPTPVGVWADDSKRVLVEIAPCYAHLCGKIVWFKWPLDETGRPLVDLMNEDPALRLRPLMGLTVLWNLRRVDANVWEGGRIYDPDDGTAYRAQISMREDGALSVRTYRLLPLFGETHIWTRVQ